MKRVALLALIASSVLMAGGYKIPETSLNAVALSAANVAHSNGADAAYYNPANMVFMKDENTLETDLMYIGLSDINYQGTVSAAGPYNLNSKKENFIVPSLHYVSADVSGARFGLSIVSPVGLSRRWEEDPASRSAEEFTLETIEINPTVALPIGDKIGIAIGMRLVHSVGVVKASYPTVMLQDVEGDSVDFGYNLALSYKPTSELELGFTYRSKIDLSTEGDADLFYDADGSGPGIAALNGTYAVALNIPIPALLNIAVAYTLPTDTTIEFVYERNYWHVYSEIDFNYTDATAEAVFGTAKPKNWKDTNTFRLGITQELDKLTLMGGIIIDETPIPESTLGFELPDSDTIAVSLGSRYQINEKMNVGLAILYAMKEDRTVLNASLDGEFADSNVLIVSTGLEYKF